MPCLPGHSITMPCLPGHTIYHNIPARPYHISCHARQAIRYTHDTKKKMHSWVKAAWLYETKFNCVDSKNFSHLLFSLYVMILMFEYEFSGIIYSFLEESKYFLNNILVPKVWIFYSKCLNSALNVMKDFPEVKTFEPSQHFCQNSKLIIMNYLPCPCKIPIQNCFRV